MKLLWQKYLPLLIGLPSCLAAGWFEWTRALGGREIAWVYAFEWPLYAVIGVYMWWRIWHPRAPLEPLDEVQPTTSAPVPDVIEEDAELDAWQRHLAQLQAADPPGGPTQRS
jgi:hypothetical protein